MKPLRVSKGDDLRAEVIKRYGPMNEFYLESFPIRICGAG